ncbi:MAG: Ig-like domain-containing protein, partial [Bradymonadaceae bacterium]
MHRAHRLSTAVCLVLTLATACASDSKKRNVPPFVEAVEADASIVDPGSETTVRVTAGDPDGGGSPASGLSSSLTATWSVRGEGWSIEGSGAEATVTAPDSYRSTATVSVEVGDDGGASASGSVDLTTGSNELPRLVSLTADPNPVEPAGRVDLKADASDPRGDELSYSWSAPEGWSLGSTSGQSVDLTAPDSSEATGRVELTVSDGFEGTIRRSIRVRTTRNSRPQIASMTATPPQVAPAGTARITVDAADPDGDDLGYSWSAPKGWKVTGSGDSVKVDAPDAYGKRAEIRVEVSDPRGNTVTGRVGLSTQSNNGPIVHSLAASPPQVDRGGTSKLQVSASDPNGDTLSYSWSVSGGSGWSIKESGDRATLTAPKAPGRRVRVAVEVADPAGTVARASTVVSTVPNQPPQLVGVSASPPSIQPSGTATVTADATDPDGDSLSYSWTVPAKWSKKGSGKSIDVTAPGSYGAQATVRLEVTDSQGGRAVGAASLVTRANRAPVIASVTASPSTIDKGGKSTLEATASDPNGNSLTYNWTLPSGWKQTGGSGATIEVKGPDAFGKQGRFVVEVADGNGATARGAVVVQTQRNRPPVISDLTAGKTQLVPGKTTTVTVTAVDPDGDPLTYSWKVPKGWSGSSQSASIDITAPQTFGTSATLKAVVGDGSGTSTETIQLQTINTRPPTINSLSVSPNPVLQNGVAQATVSATDPDGDSLSYKWSFNKN